MLYALDVLDEERERRAFVENFERDAIADAERRAQEKIEAARR